MVVLKVDRGGGDGVIAWLRYIRKIVFSRAAAVVENELLQMLIKRIINCHLGGRFETFRSGCKCRRVFEIETAL